MKQATIQIQKQLPDAYKPKLDFFQTELGIKFVKDTFQKHLSQQLTLHRVSAPRFLITGTGLQDDLAGTQTPVSFTTKFATSPVEIVHSLAKWKRHALGKYQFPKDTGLYTDMDAIRKDEDISPIHSIYVDQWDWEKRVSKEDRTLKHLKDTVKKIYQALKDTEADVAKRFPDLMMRLPEDIKFIHTEELERLYPTLSAKQREHEAAKEFGAFFLIGIGHPLSSGKPHDVRAADYDDWHTPTSKETRGLNGDIIVWDHERQDALELSSMGIRVDADSLKAQLDMHDLSHRSTLDFHSKVLSEQLPLSMGGGIGQSRICLFFLQKAHIGEVQSSIWPKEVHDEFESKGVPLL